MPARSGTGWTQRQPHLAGALPAARTARFIALGWLSRGQGHGLRITEDYDQRPANWLRDAR